MPTSSDHRDPPVPIPHGDHWLDLTATLCRDATNEFGDWLSNELAMMDEELNSYVTPNSLRKSLRRQAKTLAQ